MEEGEEVVVGEAEAEPSNLETIKGKTISGKEESIHDEEKQTNPVKNTS